MAPGIRSVVLVAILSLLGIASSSIPDKYPVEVFHMLQERTQFGSGREHRARGSWGPWSSWSECSKSCGTGIQSQGRECVPFRGVLRKRSVIADESTLTRAEPFCIGTYRRYHVCNTRECPDFTEDFRAEQCAKYNGRTYKGRSYVWVPFLDGPNTCALNCRAIGERFYATLEPAVVDGTPCETPSRYARTAGAERRLCVAGQCKSVGCDGVVGSGASLDACGICGGEGKGCRLFEGIFIEPILATGYRTVTTIPRGAMSLNISELRHSANFLALRYQNGSYSLNGPWSPSPSGTYKVAGTTLSYQRGDRNRMETITAPGPLNASLDLEILYKEVNQGVLYKYMLPLNETTGDGSVTAAPPLFASGTNDRGNEIPDSNAGTVTISTSRTYERESRKKMRKRKEEMKHPPTTIIAGDQPKLEEKSGGKKKKFAWKVVGLTSCSKPCGGGLQHPIIKCIRESNQMLANEKRCRNVEKLASPRPLRCNDRPCAARWRAGPWSDCSVSCGVGVRTRQLECVQELNSKLTMRVAAGACTQPPDLTTSEPCDRSAVCSRSGPELRSMPMSLPEGPKWDVGSWGPCSATCGQGVRERIVTCITTGKDCPLSDKPNSREPCFDVSCQARSRNAVQRSPWLFAEWSSECSAMCGHGVRTRQVACADGSELFCNPEEKPIANERCVGNGINCDRAKWFAGPWSMCTVSCGVGVELRDVTCVAAENDTFRIVSSDHCDSARPETERRCRMVACPARWFTSNWSECSKTCGGGMQNRLVRCIREGVSASTCSESHRPEAKRPCNIESCEHDGASIRTSLKKAFGKVNCTDKYPNCDLVVKANLCRIKYYEHSCCDCRG